MNKMLPFICLLSVLISCTSCISLISSKAQSWESIQSLGGLRVDNPVRRHDGTTFLPVVCDVTGLRTITVKPTTGNSALVVRKIRTKIKNDTIQIQILTCLTDNKHKYYTKGVKIDTPPQGTYKVEYLNPDGQAVFIRTVEIK